MSEIYKLCQELKQNILESGNEHGTTKELLMVAISFDISGLDLSVEDKSLMNAYGVERYLDKYSDEKYHYEQLRYSLLHKVKEVEYFFGANIENRKIVVTSTDCISLVQYLKRGKESVLSVYMRSSDVEALLPMDVIALCTILRCMNEVYSPGETLREVLMITIGSAHVYLSGGRG